MNGNPGVAEVIPTPQEMFDERRNALIDWNGLSKSEYLPRRKVLFVTSEMADFVKVGGLGVVSAALPRALRQMQDVRVLMPGYRDINSKRDEIQIVGRLPAASGLPACDLGRIETPDGLIVYFILCPDLYDREGSPYADKNGIDWPDNDTRFARLSLAAAEFASGLADPDWRPDLLHLNDWPSALAAAYCAWGGQTTPSILTIHNLAYQGLFAPDRLPSLAIPEGAFQVDGVEFHGKLSFLKAGIVHASHVTTVSSRYAREITTPELGCGLDGLLRIRSEQGRLTGILNGIDVGLNQREYTHSATALEEAGATSRTTHADQVRQLFCLSASHGPLFAVVSRLVHQKGIDLTIQATESILRQGGQLVITGRGDAHFEASLREMASHYSGNVGVKIGFDESDAQKMFAGGDFLLMPSRFEPCGLSQMYAQRCGMLPVAVETGGLADTIDDDVTGFLFQEASLADLLGGIYRAIDTYRSPSKLNAMRKAAMKQQFGWKGSASRYQAIYESAVLRS
jgi:starch synthase